MSDPSFDPTTQIPAVPGDPGVPPPPGGPVVPGDPGVPLGAAGPPPGRSNKAAITGLVIAILLLVVALVLVVTRPKAGENTATTGTTTTTLAAGADLGDASGSVKGTATTSTTTTSSSSTTATTAKTPPTTTAPTTAPPTTAASTTTTAPPLEVDIPTTITCPYPSGMVKVRWTAAGATSVDLAIDGPGLYKSYPGSSGSDDVPFTCPNNHTYTFTAHAPSGDTTKTFTIVAKVPPTSSTTSTSMP